MQTFDANDPTSSPLTLEDIILPELLPLLASQQQQLYAYEWSWNQQRPVNIQFE